MCRLHGAPPIPPPADPPLDLPVAEADFPGLAGTLHRRAVVAPSPAFARLAILPGYGDHSGRYVEFMRWMARRGVTCHALDFRGHGLSAGRRGFVRRWDEFLDDLNAFLAQPALAGDGPLFVLGHSHGGLVVATLATLFFVPVVYTVLRRKLPHPKEDPELQQIPDYHGHQPSVVA